MISATASLRAESLLHIYYLEGTIPGWFSIEHPAFLGNWEEEGFSFLFFLEPATAQITQLTEQDSSLKLLDTFQMTYEEWQGGSIQSHAIGRFTLRPPWLSEPIDDDSIPISLNAGVVFGNGTHPTTADCLAAIEIACRGGKVRSMLDLGTGTGVLALAAAKLGCSQCLAVDYNFLATQTARINVVQNHLTDSVLVARGRAEQFLNRPADLLVANIHYAVMRDIVRSSGFLQQKWFILSGLLTSEAEKITSYLRTQPVLLLNHWEQNGVWHTFLGITEEQSGS